MLGPFFQTPPPGHEKERRVAVKHHRAEELEARVWKTISGLLKEPERLRTGLEAMIEREREFAHGDPEARWIGARGPGRAERCGAQPGLRDAQGRDPISARRVAGSQRGCYKCL